MLVAVGTLLCTSEASERLDHGRSHRTGKLARRSCQARTSGHGAIVYTKRVSVSGMLTRIVIAGGQCWMEWKVDVVGARGVGDCWRASKGTWEERSGKAREEGWPWGARGIGGCQSARGIGRKGAVEYVGKVRVAGGCGQERATAGLTRALVGQERRLAKSADWPKELSTGWPTSKKRPSEHHFPVQWGWGFSLGGPALCASVFICAPYLDLKTLI